MAKSQTPKGGPSRIRFVMLEADVQDGDLSQITQAIQNAFRSTPSPSRPATPQARLIASERHPSDPSADNGAGNDDIDGEAIDALPTVGKAPRKRSVAKTPDVLSDIDTESSPSLKNFVSGFDAKTGVDKYLVIALWFRDARSTNSFTVDHIYTCFRLLNWSTSSSDFSKPLKNLRDEQSLTGGAKGYSLTLVGAGKIEAKKRG